MTKFNINNLDLYKDEQLVDLLKSESDMGKDEAIVILKNRHFPLIISIYKSYSLLINKMSARFEHVIPNVELFIYEMALSYNPNKKTKFSTYLGSYVRYKCLNVINKTFEISTDNEKINQFQEKKYHTFNLITEDNTYDYLYYIIQNVKCEKVKKIVQLRFFAEKPKTWQEIGRNLGMTAQNANNIFRKFKKLAKKKLLSRSNVDIM